MRFSAKLNPLKKYSSWSAITPRIFPGEVAALEVIYLPERGVAQSSSSSSESSSSTSSSSSSSSSSNSSSSSSSEYSESSSSSTEGDYVSLDIFLERQTATGWASVQSWRDIAREIDPLKEQVLVDETIVYRTMVDNAVFRWRVVVTDEIGPLSFYSYFVVDLVPTENYTAELSASVNGCYDFGRLVRLSSVQGNDYLIQATLYGTDEEVIENLSQVTEAKFVLQQNTTRLDALELDVSKMSFDNPSIGTVSIVVPGASTSVMDTGIYYAYLQLGWETGYTLEWPKLFELNLVKDQV